LTVLDLLEVERIGRMEDVKNVTEWRETKQ
jgi:hypothetical protein